MGKLLGKTAHLTELVAQKLLTSFPYWKVVLFSIR